MHSGTWLTPADEAILEWLRDHGPASVDELVTADALDYRRAFVEERCSLLAGRDRLVVFSGGRYWLTGRGEAYLAGALEPDELGRG